MLLYLLFSNTAHFALTVLTAFVFFSAGLLYLDSSRVSKSGKTLLIRSIGFFAIALVYTFYATSINSSVLLVILEIIKIAGLALILFSLTKEPILHPPRSKKGAALIAIPILVHSAAPVSAALMLLIAATYFRKSTEGYEKQLRPAGVAFLILGIAEFISVSYTWGDTSVVFWSKLLARFGTVWNIQSIFGLVGILILGFWVWGYIRFRLQIQVFVITIALSILIFLATTTFYTFLLLNNLQNDALEHLKTDVNVMEYSLKSLESETLAHAEAVAQDNVVKEAFVSGNQDSLYELTSNYLVAQNINTLVVVKKSGEVAIRAENSTVTNDSLKGDTLFDTAISGQSTATISTIEGITTPEAYIKAAVPITSDGEIIGAVVSGVKIDNTFVDSVKNITGLDTTIFANDKRAATTFVGEDGKSRYVGTLESDANILSKVLNKSETYVGTAERFNQPYYVAIAPLTTFDKKTVGMLSVGKLQNTLTVSAQESIGLTFLGSVILMIISMIPAYFFSKFLKKHLGV